MEKVSWTGNNLWKLLNYSDAMLRVEYPQVTWGALTRTRRKYREKIRKGIITMPKSPESTPGQDSSQLDNFGEILRLHNMTPELAQEFTEQGFHVGYIKNQDKEIEYTIPLPHARRAGRGLEQFEPIPPANIRPTRAKRTGAAVTRLLIYGDGQVDFRRIINPVTDAQELVPLHNLEMHRILLRMNARLRPHKTINLGDFADMSALSAFRPDSDHFHKTLSPALSWIHNFYAQLTADNPNEHIEVDSNHPIRVKKRVLENLSPLHDFVIPGEEYPLMTYYRLANLGKLGINFVSGYGNAEYVYGEDVGVPWVFKHGTHSSSTLGATVRKEAAENPEVSIARAHGHGEEHVATTDRQGRTHLYYMIGSSCVNNSPVPGYRSSVDDFNRPVKYHNQKHVNSFMILEDYGNGIYQPVIVNVQNGVAVYNGEVYDGREPFAWEDNFGYQK